MDLVRLYLHKKTERTLKRTLQTWIDRFGFERENAKDAFVYAPEGFFSREAFESLDTQGTFAKGEGTFCVQTTLAEAVKMVRQGVIRSVDNAQIFWTTALYSGLNSAATSLFDEIEWLDDHPFAAARR